MFKNLNRMIIPFQALVHDYPSQPTAGKSFGSVMTEVHALRPSLVSVRVGIEQPNEVFTDLKVWKKSCI